MLVIGLSRKPGVAIGTMAQDPTFLLDRDSIVDANPQGRSLVGTLRAGDLAGRTDRAMLMDHLDRLVPGTSMALASLEDGDDLARTFGATDIQARRLGPLVRLRPITQRESAKLELADFPT
jgi:hypothetical protein